MLNIKLSPNDKSKIKQKFITNLIEEWGNTKHLVETKTKALSRLKSLKTQEHFILIKNQLRNRTKYLIKTNKRKSRILLISKLGWKTKMKIRKAKLRYIYIYNILSSG